MAGTCSFADQASLTSAAARSKPFSAGQSPDQIEKVLNQSGESGWEVVATFVKQDSTLCFVLKKTTGLKLAAE